ncbi:hypothetical protein [Salinisphaera aquimarina]|uniref:YjbF family lipoprotein n=1 Tax=Salinisphaera aquimarina TaxID=2094031 RepID=A0ABV7EUY3_9GAMM
MRTCAFIGTLKDRLRAVFLCVLGVCFLGVGLAGCSTNSANPLVSTLSSFLPGRADVSDRARDVSYASIDFGIGGRGGLLILSNISQGLTFWQTSRRETVVLRDGYLESSGGLVPELHMTRISGYAAGDKKTPWSGEINAPVHYTVTRSWTNADGETDSGRASADLVCAPGTVEKKLPLTTRALERCVETLSWERGKQTASVLWRDPENHRVWAAEVVAWPGSPLYEWRVARPWW